MEHIIKHIFANLFIFPSVFVDVNKTKSLMTKEFLLNEKIHYENDIKNNIWGCQVLIENSEMKVLLGDCSQDINVPEYCLLVQLKDAPAYGLYIIYDKNNVGVDPDPLISCSLSSDKESAWIDCNTYLQATFLAGMEQIKDYKLTWNKCSNYLQQYELMLSFIKHYNSFYENKYERQ